MNRPDRRAVVASAAGAALLLAAPGGWRISAGTVQAASPARTDFVCCIRYVIDPAKLDRFEDQARRWAVMVPRCGGTLLGVFAPHEGADNVALALIAFADLAEYDAFEARMHAASGAAPGLQGDRVVLSESRTFLRRI